MKCAHVLIGALLLGSPSYPMQHGDAPPKPNIRVTTNATEQRPGTAAWEWSDEERIKVRFDPIAVRERIKAHGAQSAERLPSAKQYVLYGARDAALFLPVELLDVLLQGLHSDASIRVPARTALAKGIRDMGYTENAFWTRLENLSGPYRALLSKPGKPTIQRVQKHDGTVTSFPVDVERCVARYNLLQSARTTFDAHDFQRFLYVAVAPEVKRVMTTQQIDPAQELLFVAKGCRQ